ncbi:MAG: cyclopropane-fatty-acyl-phospholipid synthase family protein [Planctomycetota bacterium]
MSLSERLLERGLLPDFVVRYGIRRLLRDRLRAQHVLDPERVQRDLMAHLAACESAPIAEATGAANAQHYEVPAAFYQRVLGPNRKYSSGLWDTEASTLEASEAKMLRTTCERGQLKDGMRVLDLGCGWGSLSMWIARNYRNCKVLGVSNSHSQRQDIEARAKQEGLSNLEIVTADANHFAPGRTFDRVFSVEMFEHMKNWRQLLARIASWLEPEGRMFLHIFTHRSAGYSFVEDGDGDWMARQFFTGGQMPSDSQMLYLQDHLAVEDHWRVAGTHYQRTSEAWLLNMDRARSELWPLFEQTYGQRCTAMWHGWRTFFMACAELWGFDGGREWFVSHYLLKKR